MPIRSAAEWDAILRQRVTDASPVALDLSRPDSIEAAIVFAVAEVTADVDQGAQLARDATSSDTATGGALSSIYRQQGVERRPATRTRYTTRAVDGPATLDGGELARGGGPSGRTEWRVITEGVVDAGDPVVIEAVTPGPVALSSGATTIQMVTTTPGLTALVWDSGVDPVGQIGRARESDAELRIRGASGGGGLRAALRALPWVQIASVDVGRIGGAEAPGRIAITIAPAPVGADQTAELVDTIGRYSDGIVTQGAETGTYTPPDSPTRTVRWDVGGTDSVPFALTIVRDSSTIPDAEIEASIQIAVGIYLTSLARGETVIRQRVIAEALGVSGVVDVTACTIDSSAVNYTPDPTDFVLPSSWSITVTT